MTPQTAKEMIDNIREKYGPVPKIEEQKELDEAIEEQEIFKAWKLLESKGYQITLKGPDLD